jgi:hypothetical protein
MATSWKLVIKSTFSHPMATSFFQRVQGGRSVNMITHTSLQRLRINLALHRISLYALLEWCRDTTAMLAFNKLISTGSPSWWSFGHIMGGTVRANSAHAWFHHKIMQTESTHDTKIIRMDTFRTLDNGKPNTLSNFVVVKIKTAQSDYKIDIRASELN